MQGQRFTFGPFLLDPDNGMLLRRGEPVAVGRRGILLMASLLRRHGEVVTKAELMDAAWPGLAVEDSNLSVQIALLRKALGSAPGGGEWIATVPRVGYRFLSMPPVPGSLADPVPSRPSLAILPFINLSRDPEQEFFADGLADEVATNLSQTQGLAVIARSSSFAYKGANKDVRRVARDLGARFVAEGSIRFSGIRVRVIAQLSDGLTGRQLWADRYDRELDDLFAVQDGIADGIAAGVGAALGQTEAALRPAAPPGGTTDAEAHRCFLHGRAMQRGATQNSAVFERTSDLFRRAIARDPAYPAPYAALGMALAHAYYNRWTGDPERSLVEAGTLADEAIRRDPAAPFAHGVAALVAMYRKDFARWASETGEALSRDPDFAPALSLRAMLNTCSGEPRTAIRDLERAMRLDPFFTQTYLHHLGVAHIVAGDDEVAVSILKERVLLVPDTDMSRACLCAALGNLGRVDEAQRVRDELMTVNPAYSFDDGLDRMPFRSVEGLSRIRGGLDRAGVRARVGATG